LILSENKPPPDTLTANTELVIGNQKLKLKLVVPAAEVPPESLLPTLQQLADVVTDGVEKDIRQKGAEISCRKGCGACCRQHVPISPAEARLLADIVENMPEPARDLMKTRFEDAARRLKESGVLDRAMNYHRLPAEEIKAMVLDYFKLGIACPFLEDEACSIHPFRPLICREYLVISPPEYCSTLDEEHLQRPQYPVSVASAFADMEGMRSQGENKYVPLVMSLEWTEQNPDERELRPGPNWIQQFFQNLSGTDLPDPDTAK